MMKNPTSVIQLFLIQAHLFYIYDKGNSKAFNYKLKIIFFK